MLVMVVFFIAFRWTHLSTPLIRLFLLVLILLLMPTLNFLPVWFALSLLRFRLPSRLPTRDGLIRVRNIRALNGRFNTSITHAYSIVIGSKHITLNATGGGFLTASKQFRHGATSKSRSNTASNSTKHKSPHLSGWRQIISLIT